MKKLNFQKPRRFSLATPALIFATLTLTACTLFTSENGDLKSSWSTDLNGDWNVERHLAMEAGFSGILSGKMILVENGNGISGNIHWRDTTIVKDDSVYGTLTGDSINLVLKREMTRKKGSRSSENSFTLGVGEPHVMGSSDIWTCTR